MLIKSAAIGGTIGTIIIMLPDDCRTEGWAKCHPLLRGKRGELGRLFVARWLENGWHYPGGLSCSPLTKGGKYRLCERGES